MLGAHALYGGPRLGGGGVVVTGAKYFSPCTGGEGSLPYEGLGGASLLLGGGGRETFRVCWVWFIPPTNERSWWEGVLEHPREFLWEKGGLPPAGRAFLREGLSSLSLKERISVPLAVGKFVRR